MTTTLDPIANIRTIEQEAEGLLKQSEEKAQSSINKVREEKHGKLVDAQNQALETAKNVINKTKENLQAEEKSFFAKIDAEVLDLRQKSKNNFSKINSYITKEIS